MGYAPWFPVCSFYSQINCTLVCSSVVSTDKKPTGIPIQGGGGGGGREARLKYSA